MRDRSDAKPLSVSLEAKKYLISDIRIGSGKWNQEGIYMAPSLWKRDATEVRKHAGSSKHFLLYYITGIFSFEVSLTTILLYSPKANAIWLSSLKIFLPPDDLTYCCQVGLSNFCLTFSFSSLQIKTGSSCLMGSVPNFSPLLSQFSIT